MATLSIDGEDVVLHLGVWEKAGAMHGDIRVPLSSVRDVRVTTDAWRERRGIRAPGTGFPRAIALGTFRGSFGKDFAAVYRKGPAVIVELEGAPFKRLLVSDDVADATVARIRGRLGGSRS